jgi:hydrogenase maturation protein HypF
MAQSPTSDTPNIQRERIRLRVAIRGAVQGVGFRPFIFRLASELKLAGWVKNSSLGVFVEAEGDRDAVQMFLHRLQPEKPPHSFIQSLESSHLDPAGYEGFEIRESDPSGVKSALILPDVAVCDDCMREVFDAGNRRYLYPFTNCTHCGPRFSIIESLPYDRPNTSMRLFQMCPRCRSEYEDPRDRRFHAQPNACAECGPHVELWDTTGACVSDRDEAIRQTARTIHDGAIVAVKGLGGFHLMVDARSDQAVKRLRELKHREEKPLALMFPSVDAAKSECDISRLEERLLRSPESPIVLLRRRQPTPAVAESVAPKNPCLGVLLPYTPLHHLLMRAINAPVVATSGNISDEPICIDECEALLRLGKIADLLLIHNRPIVRHVDDSIVRVMMDREMVVRRARGFAPLPVTIKKPVAPTLAVGAHLKNTVALAVGDQVFISQHIGDLETEAAFAAFRNVSADLQRLYDATPAVIAADEHPDYLSTRYALKTGVPVARVQHHYAHVLSCMAENEIDPPVLGVAWDGTGYGSDGTVWGGEFLRIDDTSFQRVAHLRTFRLPGGEAAVKEPRRAALGMLYEMFGDDVFAMKNLAPISAFTVQELALLKSAMRGKINTPVTSSAGRLFDAVASLLGLRQVAQFEGQAAMELEFALCSPASPGPYPFDVTDVVDWAPTIRELLNDASNGLPASAISARFHNTLAEIIVAVARRVGEERIVLTGGCFQNRHLTERTIQRLIETGFRPYWHQRVPPNDGGIALGQILAAARGAAT